MLTIHPFARYVKPSAKGNCMSDSHYNLLSVRADHKTIKGEPYGYRTGILYLSPHTLVSQKSLCPFSTEGCRSSCLYTAGRGQSRSVVEARERRTRLFLENRPEFLRQLKEDIHRLAETSVKSGFIPVVRLNGTSDISWEIIGRSLFDAPLVQFYDYTKVPSRYSRYLDRIPSWPSNYHLVFSRSEENETWVTSFLARGGTVSVVFQSAVLPDTYHGFNVVNGDEHDAVFIHPPGSVIGLKAKGRARKDTTGFVVRV